MFALINSFAIATPREPDVSQRGHRMCTSFMEGTVDARGRGAWLEVTSDVRRNHVEQFKILTLNKLSLYKVAL